MPASLYFGAGEANNNAAGSGFSPSKKTEY
ncbi:hypothetical protein ES705_32158 [subsurface metagenome]